MTVMAGGRSTLTWSVKDATKINIVDTPGGNLITDGTELSGSVMTGMLTQATTFTLTAFNDVGNATASVVVSIQACGNPTGDGRSAMAPAPQPARVRLIAKSAIPFNGFTRPACPNLLTKPVPTYARAPV